MVLKLLMKCTEFKSDYQLVGKNKMRISDYLHSLQERNHYNVYIEHKTLFHTSRTYWDNFFDGRNIVYIISIYLLMKLPSWMREFNEKCTLAHIV